MAIDLVERLRVKLRSEFVGSSFGDVTDEDCQHAAATITALRKALRAVDVHWTSIFPYGPDEPDAHKHISPAALAAWRIVRDALAKDTQNAG